MSFTWAVAPVSGADLQYMFQEWMMDGWMSELMKERRERGGNNVGSYLESLNLVTPIFFNFMHITK